MVRPKIENVQIAPKKKRWLKAFIENGCNAKQAAITAGYSPHSAAKIGSDLKKDPILLPYLKEAMQRLELREIETIDDLAARVEQLATYNVYDYIDLIKGRSIVVKDKKQLPREMWYCVEGIEETMHGLKLKFVSKTAMLKLLKEILVDDKKVEAHAHVHIHVDSEDAAL